MSQDPPYRVELYDTDGELLAVRHAADPSVAWVVARAFAYGNPGREIVIVDSTSGKRIGTIAPGQGGAH